MKKHILPIGFLIIAWIIIVITSYTKGSWLMGWDNLLPEFNFLLNLKRSLFGVWQEYQGLGLLGGMGHISALPREVFLWLLSLLIPSNLLRYLWTFLMLLIGSLGAYALTHQVIQKIQSKKDQFTHIAASFISGLFYLLNLATVQTFFAPYEAFITHYAALPWLLWGAVRIFEKPSKKNLLLFCIINVVSMTQAYVPTLFLVYLIILAIVSISILIVSPVIYTVKKILIVFFITIMINSVWGLPFTYFTLTKSATVVNSKINQMATDEIYLRNNKFGTMQNTLTLKNFWFDNTELNPKTGYTEPMMKIWIDYLDNPIIKVVQYISIVFIVLGFIISIKSKENRMWSVLGLVGFAMIANDIQPFSLFTQYLRAHIPLLSQFFRFPFTKWGTSLSLSYSLFYALSLYYLFINLKKNYRYLILSIYLLVPIIICFPVFNSTLISPMMKVDFPKEYNDVFLFMNAMPDKRISYLPSPNYWDWKYYRWGYLGSGFIWYGLKQPIIDQAFDSWGKENENYYWELSRALYSKDVVALEAVFDKYDVVYILLDENIISASHNRALFIDETKELLSQIPEIKIAAVFGKLTLYERTKETQSFVAIKENLPTVSPAYTWTDNDVAFSKLGDYINLSTYNPQPIPRSGISLRETTHNYFYPFRSLFTKRAVDEREFNINETDQSIAISDIKNSTQAGILKTSTLVYDSAQTNDLNGASVTRCGLFRTGTSSAKMLSEGLNRFLRFENLNQRGCLSFGIPTLSHKDGYLVAVESRHITGRPLLLSLINQTVKHTELEVYLENSKLSAKGGSASGRKTQNSKPREEWQTNYFILPLLASDGLGYTVYLSNDSIGRHETINDIKSIRFYRIPYQKLVSQRVELCDRDQPCQAGLIPHKKTQPQGTFDQLSVNPALSVDHPNPAYYKVTFQPITYNQQPTTLVLSQMFDPGWKAWLLPAASCPAKQGLASLDKWYVVSCWLGAKELNDHVLVNNWANAWVLDPKSAYQTKHEPSEFILSIDEGNSSDLPAMLRIALQAGKANAELRRRWAKNNSNEVTNNELTIIVFYLPQLLEFIGFALLPIPFIWIGHRKNYRKEI